MKLTNLKIGVRLGLGFGVVLTLLALLVGLGLHKLDVVNTALLEVTEQGNVKLDAAEDMSVAQMRVTIATSNVVLLTDHAAMAVHEGKIAAARADYDAAAKILHSMVRSDKGKATLAKVDAAAAATRPLTDKAPSAGPGQRSGRSDARAARRSQSRVRGMAGGAGRDDRTPDREQPESQSARRRSV
ncbi:MCP four helix bundle domain-containing protein [Massilia sp. H-1]|nr:MCP four helix bundle domain-containing protein [Massilia sp. H-1]